MIYWIFGQTGAGKSTLARSMARSLKAVHLDGDELRAIWPGLTLTMADRYEQNMRAARLAKTLADQGHTVIVSTICPFRRLRETIDDLCRPQWIYLPGGHAVDADHPFEPPD